MIALGGVALVAPVMASAQTALSHPHYTKALIESAGRDPNADAFVLAAVNNDGVKKS
jgi:hypothetical protein